MEGLGPGVFDLHLADSPPEVPIAGGYDVALVLPYPLADAVIRVGALVSAGYPLNAGVLRGAS